MMKLVVMKGKYIMCCKVYLTESNIRYYVTGKNNLVLNYGLFDGERIHFLPTAEGVLPHGNRNISGVAVFAADSNYALVAYGATSNVSRKKFEESYRKFCAMTQNKSGDGNRNYNKNLTKNSEVLAENIEIVDENLFENGNVTVEYAKYESLEDNAKSNLNESFSVVEKKSISAADFAEKKADDIAENKSGIAEFLDKNSAKFYEDIKGELEQLFDKYPRNEELEMRVMDSKWVNIDFDADSYYTVGVITEGSSATVICYGVPYEVKSAPPKEIADFCQWLPLDRNAEDKGGYYVMYQNALTGDIIK